MVVVVIQNSRKEMQKLQFLDNNGFTELLSMRVEFMK